MEIPQMGSFGKWKFPRKGFQKSHKNSILFSACSWYNHQCNPTVTDGEPTGSQEAGSQESEGRGPQERGERLMTTTKRAKAGVRRSRVIKQLKNDWLLYALLLPVVAWYIIFCYLPMAGITLAFKDFSFRDGLWGSPWIGFQNFIDMFQDRLFIRATVNTIIFSLGRIAFQTPCAILLAVALNEMRFRRSKKVIQTIVTFPHFISWVVLSGMLINLFGSTGVINQVLGTIGLGPITPISSSGQFRAFIWLSGIWKEAGWDSIIYLAAITSIDEGLYEAAEVDGANRLQRIWYITLPGIRSTICIMLILAVGSILTNGGFDQIYNLYSAPVYDVADTLDTYVFRESFITGGLDYGYTTAIGFFKSFIGVIMIVICNKIVTKAGENGLF